MKYLFGNKSSCFCFKNQNRPESTSHNLKGSPVKLVIYQAFKWNIKSKGMILLYLKL